MNCRDVMHLLPDYLQGDLPTEEASRLCWHVGHCKNCRLVVLSASETLRKFFPSEEPARKAPAAVHHS